MTKKGRIYRVLDPSRREDQHVREVKTLLAEGMASRTTDALAGLLAHADMRIRQEAQFELAGRGDDGWKALARIARPGEKTLPRIHAIWGPGQVGRTVRDGRRTSQWSALEPLLADPDPEVRAQAAKVVGDAREPKSFSVLVRLLDDASPRVCFFAAIALSKLGRSEAAVSLLKLLRANADSDPYLRHAGVMGLVGSGKSDTLTKAAHDESPAVRTGVLLAMRRHEDPAVAGFLKRSP